MRTRTLLLMLAAVLSAIPALAEYRTSVWIAPWDPASLATVQARGGSIDEANPVWYSWNADGTIKKNWNAENATWRAAMSSSTLVPTIQNVVDGAFSSSLVAKVLSSADSRERHASAIAALAVQNAFDGIDIDYERVPASSRADFTAFISTLAAKLHAAGKQLSVTVYAKTSDAQNWNGPGSQDWRAIGALADTVKIMAYDYHWATSEAGVITPLGWLDSVADYAASAIPDEKVLIALPWYGYDWVGSDGKGVSFARATELARANNATVTRDPNGEPTFTYSDHTVYFQDAASYARKLERLKSRHPRFAGVAHWAAGQEDPEVWRVIDGESATPAPPGTGSSPATPVAPDFVVSGPTVVSVVEGTRATLQLDVTAINGFSETTSVSVASATQSPLQLAISRYASPSADAVLTIEVLRGTPRGSYQVIARFVGGGITREHVVNVVVDAAKTSRRRSL